MALCHDRTLITGGIQFNGSGSGWEGAKAFRGIWGTISVLYTSGSAFEAEQSVPDSLFFVKPYECDEIVA